MADNWDDVNIGNPANARRDTEERNDAKVTNADHPVSEIVRGRPGKDAEERPRPGPTRGSFDTHAETVHNSELQMPGERTCHADPLSGNTGTHALGVGVGAAAGGAAAGAVIGLAASAVAGPLGAAIGAAVATTLGALGGGYTGKRIAEKVHPTTEDNYWRRAFATREYVPRGAKYDEWEPAYEYGIDMREWLFDKTWEEAEPIIRSGWDQSEAEGKMPWEQARPAILDAWDHLTPEPGEPDVTEEEKREE